MTFPIRALVAAMAALSLIAAGCGDDGGATSGGVAGSADATPTVVVTTNILGDVVENLVGEVVNVVTVMPVGADPHDFQASAQQVAQIGDADVLIANGADFEEGLLDVIASAEIDGVLIFEAITAVDTLEFAADAHGHEGEHEDDAEHDDEHDDEAEHDDDEAEQEDDAEHDDHGHAGDDPHFFTDPARMALVAAAIVDFLIVNVDGIDAGVLQSNAEAYIDDLESLDAEVAATLSEIPDDGRVLVTNHEVFGYFADRYDFEVAGAVIPSGSTADGVSAQELAELADVIENEGVRTIFADTSSSDELTQTLAAEVGDIAVVELFSESLGVDDSDGATYIDMIRTNAQRIAAALAS